MIADKLYMHNDNSLCKNICDPIWLSIMKLLTPCKEENEEGWKYGYSRASILITLIW